MTAKNVDRRVRKTRSLLQHALQDAILEKKGYDSVTVQDILDRADVGRSTFYAHFRDKDDLLLSGFEALHADIDKSIAEGSSATPSFSEFALILFRHADENRRTFQAMMGGSSGEIVLRAAREGLRDLFRGEIDTTADSVPNPEILDAIVDFEAAALLSLVTWWLDSESTLSPEEIHALYVTLTRPGLDAALGGVGR